MRPACDILELAAPGVRRLHPYQPGKPISELEREYGVSNSVKLASNENPLGPSPAAISAMQQELNELALYPDGGGFALKQALSARHGLAPECITLGNGSNDVLVLLAEAFLTPGLEAVYSEHCFAVYPIAVQAVGATARVAPPRGTDSSQPLGHDLEAMLRLVGPATRMVFIANPNNPTGTWLGGEELRAFLHALPPTVLVVIDEAYHEYSLGLGVPDASQWLQEFPGLVVTRTFSKVYGLAGIRIGYCLSSPPVADMLNRIRQPFNVNSLALTGAVAALADRDFIERSVSLNREGLAQLEEGLGSLGLQTIPSAGNFVLVDLARPSGPVYEFLLRRGVIVRPVGNYGLPNHLRITVGTAGQNEQVLAGIGACLESHASRDA
jgi:histidinol-phosphate aminotransferase